MALDRLQGLADRITGGAEYLRTRLADNTPVEDPEDQLQAEIDTLVFNAANIMAVLGDADPGEDYHLLDVVDYSLAVTTNFRNLDGDQIALSLNPPYVDFEDQQSARDHVSELGEIAQAIIDRALEIETNDLPELERYRNTQPVGPDSEYDAVADMIENMRTVDAQLQPYLALRLRARVDLEAMAKTLEEWREAAEGIGRQDIADYITLIAQRIPEVDLNPFRIMDISTEAAASEISGYTHPDFDLAAQYQEIVDDRVEKLSQSDEAKKQRSEIQKPMIKIRGKHEAWETVEQYASDIWEAVTEAQVRGEPTYTHSAIAAWMNTFDAVSRKNGTLASTSAYDAMQGVCSIMETLDPATISGSKVASAIALYGNSSFMYDSVQHLCDVVQLELS
jgi:hypothetical protein